MKPRRIIPMPIPTDAEIAERNVQVEILLIELYSLERYVNCFVKRFYSPYNKESIFKILKYRVNTYGSPEFLYANDDDEQWWCDVEDSVVITNDMPIIINERVVNVNDPEYTGYNPYDKPCIVRIIPVVPPEDREQLNITII